MSRFRLATLERLREQQEQICARRLSESTQELAAVQQRRETLVGRLATGATGLHGDQLVMASLYRDRIREDITAASADIERCTAMLAQARDAWIQAKAQLKAVQSLHERHRQSVRAAVARAEQTELDEFAGTRGHTGRAVIGGTA